MYIECCLAMALTHVIVGPSSGSGLGQTEELGLDRLTGIS
eukprot:COSAG01_NODE_7442_length_3210_cov_15.798457_1_plen_39_part_10